MNRLRGLRRLSQRVREQQVVERAEVISLISHELRTPLTSVIGYTEVLASGDAGELNDEQIAMLCRISQNGERLLVLIEGLLDAAHDRAADGGAADLTDIFLAVFLASCEPDEQVPAYAV